MIVINHSNWVIFCHKVERQLPFLYLSSHYLLSGYVGSLNQRKGLTLLVGRQLLIKGVDCLQLFYLNSSIWSNSIGDLVSSKIMIWWLVHREVLLSESWMSTLGISSVLLVVMKLFLKLHLSFVCLFKPIHLIFIFLIIFFFFYSILLIIIVSFLLAFFWINILSFFICSPEIFIWFIFRGLFKERVLSVVVILALPIRPDKASGLSKVCAKILMFFLSLNFDFHPRSGLTPFFHGLLKLLVPSFVLELLVLMLVPDFL